MGFFDPVYKKMLAKAPAGFRAGAAVWGTFIEAAVVMHSPLNPDIFRALVVGMLSLRSADEEPAAWSHDALQYITAMTNNAHRAMNPRDQELANSTFASIVLALRETTSEEPPAGA